jgi:hypothetical protein
MRVEVEVMMMVMGTKRLRYPLCLFLDTRSI